MGRFNILTCILTCIPIRRWPNLVHFKPEITKRKPRSKGCKPYNCVVFLWPARRDSNPRPSESESAAISSFATGGYQMICLFKATVILPRLPEKSNRSHQKIGKIRTPPMRKTARRQIPAAGSCLYCFTNTDFSCPQRGHRQVSGSVSKGSSPS